MVCMFPVRVKEQPSFFLCLFFCQVWRGYTNRAVCLCVCLCVSTLTAGQIDVRSKNLVQGLTLMTSQMSLMVKVIGQGHLVEKCNFGVLAWVFCPLIAISARKAFMCIYALNFTHAQANFVHANVQNKEICTWAQIGSARGRCSNTLVFLLWLEWTIEQPRSLDNYSRDSWILCCYA